MKFGHVAHTEIDSVDFSLPPDHPKSIVKVRPGDPSDFTVYVGCGKWGIPEWVGPIYPEGTKEKDFLSRYVECFNSIELNNTFYRISRGAIQKWVDIAAGSSFKFCPKWSRRITHLKRMADVEENTQYFIDSFKPMGPNLGTTFLSLPHNFGPKYIQRVHDFLDLIPHGYPLHIEFRHKDWFKDETFDEMMSALEAKGVGAVITDVALRRDVLHQRLTTDEVFIRFNGYGLDPSDFTRLDDWVYRLMEWKNSGLQRVYFFNHQENESHTPVLCDYFSKKINKHFGTSLPTLNLPDNQSPE
ncbi:MAG: DUF72 domain-containing protein [Saprospiraceae bacterium]|nr:DUF72 domain-containing protein [Saprospiraceae bacterium]